MSKRVKNRKGKPKGKYNAQFMRERARRLGSHTPLLPAFRLGDILKW